MDGRADVSLAGETLELCLSSPRGFTPSEVILVLALLRLPFDRSADVSLAQLEVFRDGDAARFEGVEARTYRNAEGLLWKAYNHTDARGTLARLEVRPPAVRLTWSELEAFFEARQPLGRDAKVDALALEVRENSEAVLMLRREVKRALKAIGSREGSDTSKGGGDDAVR